MKRLMFGMHRNRLIVDVSSSYLQWLLDEPGFDSRVQKVARAELERRARESAEQARQQMCADGGQK